MHVLYLPWLMLASNESTSYNNTSTIRHRSLAAPLVSLSITLLVISIAFVYFSQHHWLYSYLYLPQNVVPIHMTIWSLNLSISTSHFDNFFIHDISPNPSLCSVHICFQTTIFFLLYSSSGYCLNVKNLYKFKFKKTIFSSLRFLSLSKFVLILPNSVLMLFSVLNSMYFWSYSKNITCMYCFYHDSCFRVIKVPLIIITEQRYISH